MAFEIVLGILGCGFIIYYAHWLDVYREDKRSFQEQLGICPDRKKIKDNVTFTVSFCLVVILTLVASIWTLIINLS
jgi:hypothetical protein